jgi:hypothetical protein
VKKPDNLTIKEVEGAWSDLSRWLVKGGAAIDPRWFYRSATTNTWKNVIKDRLPFVEAARDYFNYEVTRGTKVSSLAGYASYMNTFMQWVDENNIVLSLDDNELEEMYLAFDEYCYQSAWIKKEVEKSSAYHKSFNVSQSLSKILGRPAHALLRYKSRTVKAFSRTAKTSVSRAAEKQHLGDTSTLGYYCVDLANAITIESVYGQLPIRANSHRPDGTVLPISIVPPGLQSALDGKRYNRSRAWAKKMCAPTTSIGRDRAPLLRLRLLAELVILVYQTGMNVSLVLQIERKGFKYKSQGNSDWLVTGRKGRKQGPVSFTIYKEYRERFKRLIDFVDHFFPGDTQLFPISTKSGRQKGTINYEVIKNHAARDGVPWIPPRVTRNTRANFLDRQSGDPNISDEMSQHTREVFRQNYERPSQQRAMTALTHFWEKNPISLINSGCDAKPESTEDRPSGVISPNCINESGCLWCKSHRDIDSEDYVWSLATFRHLKLIEAAQPIKREIPSDLVIERLADKLQAFRDRNEKSRKWVDEALLRIEEGDYHPTWKNVLNFWESR